MEAEQANIDAIKDAYRNNCTVRFDVLCKGSSRITKDDGWRFKDCCRSNPKLIFPRYSFLINNLFLFQYFKWGKLKKDRLKRGLQSHFSMVQIIYEMLNEERGSQLLPVTVYSALLFLLTFVNSIKACQRKIGPIRTGIRLRHLLVRHSLSLQL